MPETAVVETDADLAPRELAERHGLASAGALPSLPAYARQLWAYRHFIASYASARVSSALGTTRLGALWQVLTPLTNAAVYYLIFGVILNTQHGVKDFISYLCTGVFVFGFTQATVQAGVQAVTGNLGLIRALHFPRASLPIGVALIEVRNMVASMAVLILIVLIRGEPITWEWVFVVPVLLLQSVFNAGLATATARLGAQVTDLKQLIPFIMRIWLYASAVIYPVQQLMKLKGPLHYVLEANPMLIFIELMRYALLENVKLLGSPAHLWTAAVGWTVIVGLGGFAYFWRGEKEYGRG
jgi:teichoic acid transport system permease protein